MVLQLRAGLILIALVAACTLSASPAQAQQKLSGESVLTKGPHPERAYFSPLPFEHLDPSNGHVVLSFTHLERASVAHHRFVPRMPFVRSDFFAVRHSMRGAVDDRR